MRRRDFLGALGGATIAPWSAAWAQPAAPVIGYLHSGTASAFTEQTDAFHQGMKRGGYVVGQNISVEYRWADGRPERLPELVADLVVRNVAAIAALGGNNPVLAAKSNSGGVLAK